MWIFSFEKLLEDSIGWCGIRHDELESGLGEAGFFLSQTDEVGDRPSLGKSEVS